MFDEYKALVRELQRSWIRKGALDVIRRIELGAGSEVTNLTVNVTLRIVLRDGRDFDIFVITPEFAAESVRLQHDHPDWAGPKGVFASAEPLVIVDRITGDSLIDAACRYVVICQLDNS